MPVPEYEITDGTRVTTPEPVPTTDTGTPKYGAIRPNSSNGAGEQRWSLLLYPVPDGSVEITYRYSVVPDPLSNLNRFPLGGRQHAELFLASCLAVAEERENDGLKTGQSPAMQKFMERLAAAIHLDKSTGQPTDTDATSWEADGDDTGNTIKSLIGLHMGFGQNPKAWTTTQEQMVLEAVRQGVRRFYVPPPIPGRRDSHVWSFLNPVTNLNLTSGTYVYDLPADFGGMDSPMTHAPGQNIIYPPIDNVGEHRVRQMLQSSAQANGRPTHCGVRQKDGVSEGGTRYEILFWPIPDDSYELHYRYRVSPGNDVTIIHGGSAHFQTILESCRAAADAMQKRKQRPHEALFMERLVASVLYDQQLSVPAKLGYNRDGSDRAMHIDSHRYGYGENSVTYIGYNS